MFVHCTALSLTTYVSQQLRHGILTAYILIAKTWHFYCLHPNSQDIAFLLASLESCVMVTSLLKPDSSIKTTELQREQATLGHNTVADGWAVASNPHLHPSTLSNVHKKYVKCSFSNFSTRSLPTD